MSCIVTTTSVVKKGADGNHYSLAPGREYQVPSQIPQDVADELLASGCAIECPVESADPALVECLETLKELTADENDQTQEQLEEIEACLEQLKELVETVDHTDDDLRPVAPLCYTWVDGASEGEFVGYLTVDEAGASQGWQVISGAAPPAQAVVTCTQEDVTCKTATGTKLCYSGQIKQAVNLVGKSLTLDPSYANDGYVMESENGAVTGYLNPNVTLEQALPVLLPNATLYENDGPYSYYIVGDMSTDWDAFNSSNLGNATGYPAGLATGDNIIDIFKDSSENEFYTDVQDVKFSVTELVEIEGEAVQYAECVNGEPTNPTWHDSLTLEPVDPALLEECLDSPELDWRGACLDVDGEPVRGYRQMNVVTGEDTGLAKREDTGDLGPWPSQDIRACCIKLNETNVTTLDDILINQALRPVIGWANEPLKDSSTAYGAAVKLEFSIEILNGRSATMIGLNSDPDANASWNTLDFAVYFLKTDAGGSLRVYESGGYKYGTEQFTVGDTIAIERDAGGVVTYSLNGNVFYTSVTNSSGDLFLDSSALGNSYYNGDLGLNNITITQ